MSSDLQQNTDILLHGTGLTKMYAANTVLSKVDFEIRRGEVHALVGENGAGKSTLVKLVTGIVQRNSGRLEFNGTEFPMTFSAQYAQKMGIAVIHQEFSLIPGLTVAQNIFLGWEPEYGKSRIMNRRLLNIKAQELIDKYEFPLNAMDSIDKLSVGKKQLVEILKAVSLDSKLIIMDEPTSALNAKESLLLFKIIRQLRDRGVSVLYISHRMEEVYELSDRVTVLRDGFKVKLLEREEISAERIISLMIGRNVELNSYEHSQLKSKVGELFLKVDNLSSSGKFKDISFNLRKGEILGFAGLVGSGRTEIARALYGADPFDSGSIEMDGEPYEPSIRKSIRSGFGFVPEDRREQGIIAPLTINKNIGIANLDFCSSLKFVNSRKELELSRKGMEMVNVKPSDPEYMIGNLSGGNQQKVVVAKWLVRDLKILIIDEPTAGIDVGAKDEIYSIVERLAEQGVSVIVISSDLPELIRLSDRILVLREGSLIKEFKDCEIDEETVLKASSGILEESK